MRGGAAGPLRLHGTQSPNFECCDFFWWPSASWAKQRVSFVRERTYRSAEGVSMMNVSPPLIVPTATPSLRMRTSATSPNDLISDIFGALRQNDEIFKNIL